MIDSSTDLKRDRFSFFAKAAVVGIFSLAAVQAVMAQAGPPMLTDDPGTAAKGKFEINTAAAIQRNRDGSSETLLPIVDVSYGAADNVELSFESHWLVLREPGDSAKAGWDDTTLAFKWRFFDEEKAGIDMSIEPQYTFNTGPSAYRRGIVAKNSDILIPFEFGKTVGPVVINAEVGRDFHAHNSKETDYWFAGLTAGHQFNPNFEGVVELYVPAIGRNFKGPTSVILNFGGRYKLGENSSIIVSSGTGIGGADRPKFIGYYGIQFVY